jgi:hypothetical protein
VQKPPTRVISDEPNSHVVRSRTGRHNIATDGVGVVVCHGACASDDVECVLWGVWFWYELKEKEGGKKKTHSVQVEWMLTQQTHQH